MNSADAKAALMLPITDNNHFDLPWAMPNVDFTTPAKSEAWARSVVFSNSSDSVEIFGNGQDEVSGILQIDLFYPAGQGDYDILSKADEISAKFTRGTPSNYGSACIIFGDKGIGSPQQSQGWYRLIMSINFTYRFDSTT